VNWEAKASKEEITPRRSLRKKCVLSEIVKQGTLQDICITIRKRLTEEGVAAAAAVGETFFPLEREEAVDA
jgi:hypothetical protein